MSHVLSWGDRRDPIFHDDADREVRLAQRLREETMVTLGWIARRPQMGAVAHLNNRLYLHKGRLE